MQVELSGRTPRDILLTVKIGLKAGLYGIQIFCNYYVFSTEMTQYFYEKLC